MGVEVRRAAGTAMSCDVHVVVVGPDAPSPDDALARIRQLERRWSRFLADSELSRLNAAGGRPLTVSVDTVRLVTALVEAWHVTDGAFDPTLVGALVELGYGRSRTGVGHTPDLAFADGRGRPGEILVDPAASVVQLPVGTALDPGGLGKGLAADIVVEELRAAGADGAMVELGGDLRVSGRAPDPLGWVLAIELLPGEPTEQVVLHEGGLATSSALKRRWRHGDREVHHLLDPATLRSTGGIVVGSAAIAGTARWAEVFTKPAFVRGPDDGLALLDRHQVAGVAADATGRIWRTPSWERYRLPHGTEVPTTSKELAR